jgi:7-carboxy-7-deazaguanine synthase
MMQIYKLAEIFTSINGEGTLAGQLALFLRFAGCNLACGFCDTKWANAKDCPVTEMTQSMKELMQAIALFRFRMEVETNGSVYLRPFLAIRGTAFTMDYKLPGSGQEEAMCLKNLALLRPQDTVKFVAGSRADLLRARQVMLDHQLIGRCHLYISPVFGAIEPEEIVAFMKEYKLNDVNLQLQLHKIIWGNRKGV